MTAFWLKPEDHVPADGFRPLEALAAKVAEDPTLPSLDPDHFLYAARIERAGFPVLHVYRHVGSRKFLNVDEFVDVWRYTSSDKVGSERYAPYGTVREALEAIDLLRGNQVVSHLGSVVRAAAPGRAGDATTTTCAVPPPDPDTGTDTDTDTETEGVPIAV